MYKTRSDSTMLKHCACDACGSSDANALYTDGHAYCHKCGAFSQSTDDEEIVTVEEHRKKLNSMSNNIKPLPVDMTGDVKAIPDRGITKSTCEKYGVVQRDGKHLYPYVSLETGNVVAAKVRNVADKTFTIKGSFTDAPLFGQHLFTKGGKYVTIVEGELDALAAYQMTGSQWCVVSVRNGAQAALKDCKAAYEWLDSFENIVIAFDADEPGKKAAKEVSELFAGKAKVVKHTTGYKDACDYLVAGAEKDFINQWWRAEAFKPEGVVTVSDIKERMLVKPVDGLPWCFDTLTKLTYGRRVGELYGFGAGVGVGKTDVFTQQISYDMDVLNQKVGVIYLEQNVVETAQRVAGKLDRKLYHVPDANWTRDEYEQSIDRLEQRDQLYMMEHFGAMDWATVKGIIT